MKEEPLVSVIIPTYKRPDMLGRAIDSVLEQTYDNLEIIVVDDNDDNEYRTETEEFMTDYLSEYDNIRYIKHEENKGACAARNTGSKNSKGNYLAFLDDDDIWFKEKLGKQVYSLKKNKFSEFSYSNMYINDIKRDKKYIPNIKLEYGNAFKDLLKKQSGICTSSFLIEKELFYKIDGFDIELDSYQDYDFLLKISRETKLDFISEPLIIYNLDENGISKNYTKKYNGLEIILKKYENYYIKYGLKSELSKQYYRLAHFAFYNDNYILAQKHLIKAIKIYPIRFKAYIKLLMLFLNIPINY